MFVRLSTSRKVRKQRKTNSNYIKKMVGRDYLSTIFILKTVYPTSTTFLFFSVIRF